MAVLRLFISEKFIIPAESKVFVYVAYQLERHPLFRSGSKVIYMIYMIYQDVTISCYNFLTLHDIIKLKISYLPRTKNFT